MKVHSYEDRPGKSSRKGRLSRSGITIPKKSHVEGVLRQVVISSEVPTNHPNLVGEVCHDQLQPPSLVEERAMPYRNEWLEAFGIVVSREDRRQVVSRRSSHQVAHLYPSRPYCFGLCSPVQHQPYSLYLCCFPHSQL